MRPFPTPADHPERRPGDVRPEPVHVMTHRRRRGPGQPAQSRVVPGRQGRLPGTSSPISAATDKRATVIPWSSRGVPASGRGGNRSKARRCEGPDFSASAGRRSGRPLRAVDVVLVVLDDAQRCAATRPPRSRTGPRTLSPCRSGVTGRAGPSRRRHGVTRSPRLQLGEESRRTVRARAVGSTGRSRAHRFRAARGRVGSP